MQHFSCQEIVTAISFLELNGATKLEASTLPTSVKRWEQQFKDKNGVTPAAAQSVQDGGKLNALLPVLEGATLEDVRNARAGKVVKSKKLSQEVYK